MPRAHMLPVLLFAMIGSVLLSGCVSPVTSAQCVDWVYFATPADAAADADAIARGTVAESAGSTSLYGQNVTVWNVDVAEWVQGDGEDRIEVVSVPRTCETGAPYPDGDPLDADGEVLLFLRADGGRWQTITPYNGVLRAPADGVLPAEWP